MWQLEWASQAVSGKKYPEMTVSDAVRDTVNWGPLWVSLYRSFLSLLLGLSFTGLVLFA